MTADDRVSVVIPTKDRCGRLAVTLSSVLGQTVPVHEVLVVVDGARDGTVDYVRSLDDPRIRLVVNERSRGVASARNRGIAHATGEWLAFIDDDDLWAPRKLELQLSALRNQPGAGWSTTTCVSVDTDFDLQLVRWAPAEADLTPTIFSGNVVPGGGSGVVARRELVDRVGRFDEELSVLADWDLWIRLARAAPQAAVQAPSVVYLVHSSNMSNDLADCAEELAHMADKYAGELTPAQRRRFGIETELWVARVLARGGQRGAAARLFARGAWRARRPGLVGQVVAALAGPAVRRSLDRWRAGTESWRAPSETHLLVADVRWRAEEARERYERYLDSGPDSPEVLR